MNAADSLDGRREAAHQCLACRRSPTSVEEQRAWDAARSCIIMRSGAPRPRILWYLRDGLPRDARRGAPRCWLRQGRRPVRKGLGRHEVHDEVHVFDLLVCF